MNWISAIHLGPHCVSQRLTRRQSVLNSTLPPPSRSSPLPPPHTFASRLCCTHASTASSKSASLSPMAPSLYRREGGGPKVR